MYRLIIGLIAILTAMTAPYTSSAEVIMPKPIGPGSKIALITPASSIKDEVVTNACQRLRDMGYEPIVYPHALGRDYGTYPTTDEYRAIDLMTAFCDPEIDAILCTRGGYGTVRLLPMLNPEVIRQHPKWLIGYSDITDLHAFMQKAGVASIHGPMAKHIATEPDTLLATQYLFDMLTGATPKFKLAPHPYNKAGDVTGRLVGGNLLTFNGLSGTPYDILATVDDEPLILFVEDISEQIYAIERVLMRLYYSGALSQLKGLIIGQFTEYRESDDFATMEDMIYHWLDKWGFYDPSNPMPIVFNFPTGHVSDNYPMIVSGEVNLSVSDSGTTLIYTGK